MYVHMRNIYIISQKIGYNDCMKKLIIGILAHVDAGKTTLSEAMLYRAKAVRTLGRVDAGNAYLDTDAQERARGITIFSKQARLSMDDMELILVDTPGHVDFSAEMERTLAILDVAILVVSGSSGVQSHTKTLWKLLKRYNVPTVIYVNKMDMPGTDIDKIMTNMRENLSDNLSGEIVRFTENKTSYTSEDDEDEAFVLSDSIYEDIATGSEALLEEYLEEGEISGESISNAIASRLIFPCVFGSALKCNGVADLMEVLSRYVQSAKTDASEDLAAYCYKITRDAAGNRLTHLKLLSGKIAVKSLIGDEKVNEIRLYSGEKYELVTEATAGELVVIPGLTSTGPGMSFGGDDIGKVPMLEPVLSYAIRYPDTTDRRQMLSYLRELEEELPELHVDYDEEHREIRISLMGVVQTEILTKLMYDRYGATVSFDVGSISYKETITDVVEGVGHFEPLRHYAEVHLRLEPLEAGAGMQFESEVSEDLLDRNWQRLIRTHLEERIHRGVLTGSPITDMKITIVGGRAHTKHTEGGDFRQATYRAVRQGLMQAHSRLLEPYYDYTLEVPETMVGRAMTDIDRMNGTSILTESVDGVAVLNGRAPVATMHTYATELAAYTKGEGHLSLSLGGYYPCHNEDEVIARRHYDPDSDMRNPSASVFCEHGAGVIIPWYEVFERMHVPSCVNGMQPEEDVAGMKPLMPPKRSSEITIGTDEIDEIINRTAYSNRKASPTAHKGISAARAAERRRDTYIAPKEVEYKGTKARDRYLLVDGYNVIFAWKDLKELAAVNIDGARGRLLDILCNYQAICGENIIVVFDAYRLSNHPTEFLDYHNIHVVYTRTAETADHYIEHFAHEHGKKYDITVATSDGLEQVIIRGQGCKLVSSREFEQLVKESGEYFNASHGILADS